MKRLEMRTLAIIGALCSMIPWTAFFPLGLIAGIWALWELMRPEQAAAFDIVEVANTQARMARITPARSRTHRR